MRAKMLHQDMKLLIVTASFPFGPVESFLRPEIDELHRQGHRIRVIPTYPRGKMVHRDLGDLEALVVARSLCSLSIWAGAVRTVLRRPADSCTAGAVLLTRSVMSPNLTLDVTRQ